MNVFITYHLKCQLILFVIQIHNTFWLTFLGTSQVKSEIDDFNDSDYTGM